MIVIRATVGLVCLTLSIPQLILALCCSLGGDEKKADWLIDHSPIAYWQRYTER